MSTHIRRTDGWRETGACRVIFRLGDFEQHLDLSGHEQQSAAREK